MHVSQHLTDNSRMVHFLFNEYFHCSIVILCHCRGNTLQLVDNCHSILGIDWTFALSMRAMHVHLGFGTTSMFSYFPFSRETMPFQSAFRSFSLPTRLFPHFLCFTSVSSCSYWTGPSLFSTCMFYHSNGRHNIQMKKNIYEVSLLLP